MTPTPGQVAYETYERILLQRPPPDVQLLWRLMTALEQHAWEAAAQAVLDAFLSSAQRLTPPEDTHA